jgi:hypothetical protein
MGRVFKGIGAGFGGGPFALVVGQTNEANEAT